MYIKIRNLAKILRKIIVQYINFFTKKLFIKFELTNELVG